MEGPAQEDRTRPNLSCARSEVGIPPASLRVAGGLAPRGVLDSTPTREYAKRVAKESSSLGRPVYVRFLAEERLHDLDCAQIRALAALPKIAA